MASDQETVNIAPKISSPKSNDRRIDEKLTSVDWSFSERAPPAPIERIHPYPAKFIGDIPRTLLRILGVPEGTAVLDPFNGSGTTLVEAQRFGVESVGIDLNPIACLISRVKTSATPNRFLEFARTICDNAASNTSPSRWVIPNLDHWFKTDVQVAVSALLQEISKYAATTAYDALRLALSSILVRVSNQDSDTRYAAVEKPVNRSTVFEQFYTAANRLSAALDARDWSLTSSVVIEANTLTVQPGRIGTPIGLVITSPPYPNAYEYWLYHKYRMWWLGFNPLQVKAQEIGARAHFFQRDGHTEEHFWEQMRTTLSLIDAVLISEGHACFVIGRSKIRGELVDNASIIQEVAIARNFKLVTRLEREIAPNRKSFNLSHASIKTETLLVFRKP